MATESRRANSALDELLFDEGYRFEFFQAVRVLERRYRDRAPVGGEAMPSDEVVRFHALLSLNFPPSAVHEVIRSVGDDLPHQMTVAFMGLTGPLGVLPRHYTELLLERVQKERLFDGLREPDYTLRDFFDLFNHRFISLFYRAWEKYRFPVAYERARNKAGNEYDSFSELLFNLGGMGTGGLRQRLRTGDEALLYYGGLVGQQPHSATALSSMLGDYFEVPAAVNQFIGAWLTLDDNNRTKIGFKQGRNNEFGTSTILGSKFWDQQAGFRIQLGPLAFAEFCEFLPCGAAFGPLVDLTRFYSGPTLDFDIRLIVKASEVPHCVLASHGPDARRLGWSSWLKTKNREFQEDAGDVVLRSHHTRLKAKGAPPKTPSGTGARRP